jgi:hypothetical protein
MAFVLFVSCSKEDSTDTIAVDGNPISNNKKSNGSSSHDLLSGDIYKSMVIELVYVQGFEPSATAINNFISFFECQIHKPGGITVVKGRLPHQESYFTNQEISYRRCQQNNTANQIAVWALLLTEHPLQTQGTAMF